MTDKGQKYIDAATAISPQQLKNAFRATGVDLVTPGMDLAPEPIQGFAGDRQKVENDLVRSGNKNILATNAVSAQAQPSDLENTEKEKSKRMWEMLQRQQAIQQAIADNIQAIQKQVERYNEIAQKYAALAAQAGVGKTKAMDMMTANSNFRSAADALNKEKERTGRFDREGVLELLRQRGLQIDGQISDKDLQKKLDEESADSLKKDIYLGRIYDDYDRLEKEIPAKAAEAKAAGEELRQDLETITNDDSLTDEQRNERLEELRKQSKEKVILQEANLNRTNTELERLKTATYRENAPASQISDDGFLEDADQKIQKSSTEAAKPDSNAGPQKAPAMNINQP